MFRFGIKLIYQAFYYLFICLLFFKIESKLYAECEFAKMLPRSQLVRNYGRYIYNERSIC